MNTIKLLWLLLPMFFIVSSCKNDKTNHATKEIVAPKMVKIPPFQEDNAYRYIEEQLAFGYRYPGSEGHGKLVKYLSSKLKEYGAEVYEQDFKVDFLDVKGADATNIIGSYNPEIKKRILLAAHFDSRMIAEKDSDESKRELPIMGADDGASGVAVLLEIARLLNENKIEMGVDIVFFDAEDQGLSGPTAPTDTWCLGSQHWSKNPHVENYTAKYGILLDMIGAKNAQFGKEGISMEVAPGLVNKVWKLGQNMGYDNLFLNYDAGPITDDHFYVIKNLRIPMIDIINRPITQTEHGFGHYHHTHDDNIDVIDKKSLRGVGKVITAVVYNEYMGKF